MRQGAARGSRRRPSSAFHQFNFAARQHRALAGDGKAQAHAAALERDGRLKQRGPRLADSARARVVHFDLHFALSRAVMPSTVSPGLRGIFEKIGQHAL